jgi:hypothetical protein
MAIRNPTDSLDVLVGNFAAANYGDAKHEL